MMFYLVCEIIVELFVKDSGCDIVSGMNLKVDEISVIYFFVCKNFYCIMINGKNYSKKNFIE